MSLSLAGDGEIVGFDAVASGFGGLVAVKSAIFTGTQSNSTAAGVGFDVTDLSITHAVADVANRLILIADVGVSANSDGKANVGIALYDGSAYIGVGATVGSRTPVFSSNHYPTVTTFNVGNLSAHIVHTPGSGSKTYTVRLLNMNNGTSTIHVNRSQGDTNAAFEPSGASSFTLMEVSV